MHNRKIYLYVRGEEKGIIDLLSVFTEITVKKYTNHYLEITVEGMKVKDILLNAREFSLGELYQDFTAFIVPFEFDFPIEEILNLLPILTPQIYTIEKLIPEMVFLSKWKFLKELKNYYYSKFNSETIETVLGFINNNLNATKTSKVLYMHRNTLNYRLDNFIKKTEIDVRTFQGALAINLLFRR